jgi:hypothetical protein
VLLVCDKTAFLEVLKDFPAMQKQLERSATTRKDKIQSAKDKMLREEGSKTPLVDRPKLLRSNEYLADIIIGELASRDKRKKKSYKRQPTIAVPIVVAPLARRDSKVPSSINDSRNAPANMEVQSEAGTPKGNLMDMIKNLKKQREIVNSANVSMVAPLSKENSPHDSSTHKRSNSGSFTSYQSRNPESEAQSNRPQGQGDSEQDNPKVTHININKISDDPIRIEQDLSPEEPVKPKKEKMVKEEFQSEKKADGPKLSGKTYI